MEITLAKPEQLARIKYITHETIQTIYPHYYPQGAVDFELKKIQEMSFAGIRLGTISQSKQKRILLLVLAVLLIALSGGVCYLVITRFFNIYYLLAFVLMSVTSWIDLLKAILLYRYCEDCYLTEAGIVTIGEVFKKDKCRFVLAEEMAEGRIGAKYINVYKERNENPY